MNLSKTFGQMGASAQATSVFGPQDFKDLREVRRRRLPSAPA